MSRFNIPTQTPTLGSALDSDSKGSLVNLNSTNNNQDWALGEHVFPYCSGMSPMDGTVHASMSSVQAGLDDHLRVLGTSQEQLMLDLGSPPGYLQSGSQESSDNEGNGAGPLFERRKRSRSNSSRHRFNEVVTELGPEEVRWFYKEDKKTWKPFLGHDSLNIEFMFRKYCELNPRAVRSRGDDEQCPRNGVESRGFNGAGPPDTKTDSLNSPRGSLEFSNLSTDQRDLDSILVPVEPVCVRGGLYEVDISVRECYPVYWKREYC